MDNQGDIFGTTEGGGNADEQSGEGVLFRMGADGKYKVLHVFCSLADCADGGSPVDGVTSAPSGVFFGATSYGGSHPTQGYAGGTVFMLKP